MYYFDTSVVADLDSAILASIANISLDGNCLLNKVAENCSWFTPQQFSKSKLARRIYAMMGCPSRRDFQNMVRSHAIKNVL